MAPRRRDNLLLSEIEATGEGVLVDEDGERASVLNPLAVVVWLLCDGNRSVDQICDELVGHFGKADPTEIRRDVTALLRQFDSEGLVD